MRKFMLITSLLSSQAAVAEPATYKKAGPDQQGVTTFWVKCENGNVSTSQCLQDVSHCGPDNALSLMAAAVLACDSIQGLTLVHGK